MKKLIVLVLLLLVVTVGAFALEKNIGFGLGWNYATSVGEWTSMAGRTYDYQVTRWGGYGFLFFGVSRFIELNLGYIQKFPSVERVGGGEGSADYLDATGALQLGLYGKFPIPLGRKLVLFPTLGADFEYTLGDEWGMWWHDLWFRGGFGMDLFLGRKFFLRGHFLYGAALPFGVDEYWGVDVFFSHGPQIKFGMGWMF